MLDLLGFLLIAVILTFLSTTTKGLAVTSYLSVLPFYSMLPISVFLVALYTCFFLNQGFNFGLNLSLITQPLTFVQIAYLVSGLITTVIFLSLNSTKPYSIQNQTIAPLLLLALVAWIFAFTESLLFFFIAFELLLLVSLYLLRLTSKSERVVEASVEMFFWTLFGSLALLTIFSWMSLSGFVTFDSLLTNVLPDWVLVLSIIGFGVKIPVWPFFSWLLKAHVEASVEFSILLSGFIVKLGVFGLFKFFSFSTASAVSGFFFSLCFLGLVVALIRLFAQRDLKRIVALTTVIEMNWLGMCLALGGLTFDYIATYIIVAHSLTTAMEFLLVEVLTKRYGSRDLTLISGVFLQMPLLGPISFFVILVTIGFPGTPLFFAKTLFFLELLSISWLLAFTIGSLLILILPLFFIKLWAPMWFGLVKNVKISYYDISSTELLIFSVLIISSLILSFFPAILFFII